MQPGHFQNLVDVMKFLSANSVIFLFLLSVLALVIGRIFFGVSLFQRLEEIASKQEEYRRKQKQEAFRERMVGRYIELGNSFLSSFHLDAAKAAFEDALRLDPTNIVAWIGLMKSEILEPIRKNDFNPEVTEKRLEIILRENPKDKHALLALGRIYTYSDSEKALEYLEDALRQDDTLVAAYNIIGHIRDMQSRPDDALAMYEQAYAHARRNTHICWNTYILNNISYHYIRIKEYTKAREILSLLLNLDPQELIGYWNYAIACRLVGDFDAAYSTQRDLIRYFEDENVASLHKNQGVWVFLVGPGAVAKFFTTPQKLAYSYCSTALTCHLRDLRDRTGRYIQKALGVDLDEDEWEPVQSFIDYNVSLLGDERPELAGRLEQFRREYLNYVFPHNGDGVFVVSTADRFAAGDSGGSGGSHPVAPAEPQAAEDQRQA